MGRLQLHTSFFPLAWVLFFVKTGVAIDGQPQTKPWGTSYYDLPAGTHHIKVHFNYLFGPAGIGQREFQIYPGHTTRLSYSAPIFIFMSGTISEGGTEPIAQLPPGPGHY